MRPEWGKKIVSWRAQLAEIAARAEGEASVIVGDFSATLEHRSFARLVGTRWSVASTPGFGAGGRRGQPIGAGGRRCSGSTTSWLLPASQSVQEGPAALLRIDHILVAPEISVRSGRAWRARGSDHRPVSAVLRLPPSPGA
jgi:endonuclease/exonuclease/phosphatase family metal-dependent hydrolase